MAILVEAFTGARPEEVLSVKPNLLHRLGLVEALGMVRMRGLGAFQNRVRELVREAQTATGPCATPKDSEEDKTTRDPTAGQANRGTQATFR